MVVSTEWLTLLQNDDPGGNGVTQVKGYSFGCRKNKDDKDLLYGSVTTVNKTVLYA